MTFINWTCKVYYNLICIEPTESVAFFYHDFERKESFFLYSKTRKSSIYQTLQYSIRRRRYYIS